VLNMSALLTVLGFSGELVIFIYQFLPIRLRVLCV